MHVECVEEADGVWSESGAAFTIEDLPMSEDLKGSLVAWQDQFNATNPEEEDSYTEVTSYQATATHLARQMKMQLPKTVMVALQYRIRNDLSIGERVPYPGEGWEEGVAGKYFREWKQAFLRGQFRA